MQLEPIVKYDSEADILLILFSLNEHYVHHVDKYFATVHDGQTDEVIGLQVDDWSILKTEMVKDAKEYRSYISAD